MSKDFRYPINPRKEPHAQKYFYLRDPRTQQIIRDEEGNGVFNYDSPHEFSTRCPMCHQTKELRFFSTYPQPNNSGHSAPQGPCIDCSRAWYEELTAPAVTGSKGKDDEWKVANLHLYYEHFYRKRCEALGVPAVIRQFSVQELLRRYGNGSNECYQCHRHWSGIKYLTPPEDYGTHSLENVRPVCQEHIS